MLILFTDKKIESDTLIYKAVKEYCLFHNLANFDFNIERDDGKKPYMSPQRLFFNLSHSNKYTICAVSDKNIGIDLQYHDEKIDILAISKKYLQAELNDKKAFYNYYAKAEASAKFDGGNLVSKLRNLDNEGQLIPLFADYSLAVCGEDKSIFIMELYD
jgi:4'-phosphopantetheinyl transferase